MATTLEETGHRKRPNQVKDPKQKKRVQFDFTQDSLDKLDALVELVGASSRAEVIRRALFLLTDVLAAQQNGGEILIREDRDSAPAKYKLF